VRLVETGRVTVDGLTVRDKALRVRPEDSRIEVDGVPVAKATPVYLAFNKPRGLVTTRDDPAGRATIYDCLTDPSLPFVGPVGRLDKASEGLLLLTNDSRWGAKLLDPASHVDKTYHVQVRGDALATLVARAGDGVVEPESGERLSIKQISLLRTGSRGTAWFEVIIDEGKNRHLRRAFALLDAEVLRLVRVAIGPLALGSLVKGAWRHLTKDEARSLSLNPPRGTRP
jgi:23S rRNA pseudouridine2605 synthase